MAISQGKAWKGSEPSGYLYLLELLRAGQQLVLGPTELVVVSLTTAWPQAQVQ